ncbi:hypothetical protein DCC39_02065 [Pueribacillus theae]|uniref:DUF1657 domain-containing protein n=1 Tax=Pueribacillus theae TaxID=2171751 RepID=A0A2U1K7Q7_9BACI|nr:DUF1657 domain-containing protein [Pueribacillus theae]PWA13254.1 hypothetical protein DCC39_02065 [Pueribacillus theae]
MTVASGVKQCLASMKNVQATLSTLAVQSTNGETQRELHEAMMSCESVIDDLKKRISELEMEEPQYKGF